MQASTVGHSALKGLVHSQSPRVKLEKAHPIHRREHYKRDTSVQFSFSYMYLTDPKRDTRDGDGGTAFSARSSS